MAKLLMLALLLPAVAVASDHDCLSQILSAEAIGEPVEGLLAVGQAAVKKAKIEKTTICNLRGVVKKPVSKALQPYLNALSIELLSNPRENISKGANHWHNVSEKRRGKVKRIIKNHVFWGEK